MSVTLDLDSLCKLIKSLNEGYDQDTLEKLLTELISANKDEFNYKSDLTPWLLFLFFLIAFIAFDFWAETGRLYLHQHLHKGKEISWHRMLLYAIIVTALFVFIIWIAGVPITTFEEL